MGMLSYEPDTHDMHDFVALVVTWRDGPSGILAYNEITLDKTLLWLCVYLP